MLVNPLRWSWHVRFRPYARASLASQPLNLVGALMVGLALALLLGRGLPVGARIGAGIVLAAAVVLLWVVLLHRQLRRRRQTARGLVQTYELGPDTLSLSVGKDTYTLPTSDLAVSAHGRDWVAVRRPALGRRPLLLFVDDPALVPQIEAVLGGPGTR